MKLNFIVGLLGVCFLFVLSSCNSSDANQPDNSAESEAKIVSLSGAITESLYFLGYGDNIVGVDVTSTYPKEVHSKKKLGHIKGLNVEGVLGLEPTLVLADEKEKDNDKLKLLETSGVDVAYIKTENRIENGLNVCRAVAEKLGVGESEKLAELEKEVKETQQKIVELTSKQEKKPRVLFVYARGTGHMMVGGKGTSAEAMIQLAGAENAADLEQFQSFSTEGVVKAQPDVLLLFKSGLESLGGTDEFLKIAGISQTPAGKHKNIIAMDGAYLLGFGPRCHKAALELTEKLHKKTTQH